MKIRVRSLLAGVLLAHAAAPLAAQQAPATPDSLPAYLLEGVVVTTTRIPTTRAEIPQRVDVVTETDLRRTAAADVTDALKKTAAVDVIQYPGLLSGISVRGFRPQFSGINPHTLILVDGRPAGATNLATLDLGAVERIEVLRGPASALYGSSAMGGVVNVITRRSAGPAAGRIAAEYGSFGEYRGSLQAGGDLPAHLDFDLSLAAAGRADEYRTGSHRLLGGAEVVKTVPATGERESLPERIGASDVDFAGYSTRSGSLRLGYAATERWRLDARGDLFQGDHVESPGDLTSPYPYPTLNDLDRRSGEVSARGDLERHLLTARAYASRETTSYYDDARAPTFVSFRTPIRWWGVQLQDAVSLGAHTLTAGVDYSAVDATTEAFSAPGTPSAPYNPDSGIHSAALFAEARLRLLDDRLTGTLGVRLDRVSFLVRRTPLLEGARAGEETHLVLDPSAGARYDLGLGASAHASVGRAFVTPDAFAVAGYSEQRLAGRHAVSVTRGNPDLDPESSVTWDAGISLLRPRAGVDADLTYFHTDVRDRISTVVLPVQGVELTAAGDTVVGALGYRNADRARIRGVEARLSYDLGALADYRWSLRFFADATRLLRADEITAGVHSPITHVARLNADFGVEYDDLRRFSTRFSARYVGERTAPDYNDFSNVGYLRYPDFLVLDLTGSLRLADRYRLRLSLENLADESYYEVRGYDLPGRTLRAGVEVGM